MKLLARGQAERHQGVAETLAGYNPGKRDLPENFDEIDDELSAEEYEEFSEQWLTGYAAETVPELQAEIIILRGLEHRALEVVQSGNDKKWEQLSALIQDKPEMYTTTQDGRQGSRRKLIIFTEHKATLHYLVDRIGGMLGSANAVRRLWRRKSR